MSEWWTYSLTDFLLFSPQTYYRLFELYNAATWPAHILAAALGAAILVLLRTGGVPRDRIIAGMLAACWLWVAWGFLLEHYATINWAADWFAALFVAEAVLLVLIGVAGGKLEFGAGGHWSRRAGAGLFVFALVIQPLIGPLAGRAWSQLEIFGMAPDPTAVGTLGILVLASHWSRWVLLVIPVLWCAIGGATSWAMAAPDAPVLPAAAVLAIGFALAAAWPRRPAARSGPRAGGGRRLFPRRSSRPRR